MLKKDITFLNDIRKKLSCQLENCGVNFTFEVNESEIKFLDKDKIKFAGKCAKCLRTIKIKSTDWDRFNRLMGKSTLTMTKSTYDAIFEEPAKGEG